MKQEARKNVGIRENYIGQSLKTEDSWIFGQGSGAAPKKEMDPREELLEIKRREAELLHASLNGGIKVGAQKKLTQFEVEELLKKGQIERDEKDAAQQMAGLGKRKGGGGGGIGFEAPQVTVLEGTVDVKREPELPRGNVLADVGKSEKSKKKDKKKDKKKVKDFGARLVIERLQEKKDKKEKKRSKRSQSREKRRHDTPERKRRSRSRSRGRRHDSPERKRHDSPERRRRHDSPERKRHDSPERKRHDSPERKRHDSPDEKRRRHDSPDK